MEIDPFSHVALREYIEAILAERDKHTESRFRAVDDAVKLALAAKRDHTGTVIGCFGLALALLALLLPLLHR